MPNCINCGRQIDPEDKFCVGCGKPVEKDEITSSQGNDDEVKRKEREEARANKNFARADEIRDLLQQNGILIKDGAAGTTWEQLN